MAKIVAELGSKRPLAAAVQAAAGTVLAGIPRHRKNILNLSDSELAALREAFTKVYAINDERGYQYHAGIHGAPPPTYCQHGTPLFAIWHRPYLYFFEKALQDQVAGVTIPFWDWTAPEAQRNGIPKAFADKTYKDGPRRRPNPLFSGDIKFQGAQFKQTFRQPASAGVPRQLATQVGTAQGTTSGYTDYSRNLESPHNGLHGWVGGTMGNIGYAAYDPIFWAHHANVDRCFASWQAANPNVLPPDNIYNATLVPFGVTTKQMWNLRDLGYDYVVGSGSPLLGLKAKVAATKFNTPVAQFALESVNLQPRPRKLRTAYIKLHEVEQPKESLEIRVFLNQAEVSAETLTEGNPHYAGSIYLFGHGECAGSAGHCDIPEQPRAKGDLRPPHHLTPMQTQLDVTDAVMKLVGAEAAVSVTLVAVDPQGKQIQTPGIDFEAISFETV
jgi:tyrosinase